MQEESRRVVFADLDGVCYEEWMGGELPFHPPILKPDWVKRLTRICTEANAECVIISHREDSYDRKFIDSELVNKGDFSGKFHQDWRTKHHHALRLREADRAREIEEWLERNPTDRWVWIDDFNRWNFKTGQKERFIWTKRREKDELRFGLTDDHVEQALAILRK